MINDEPVKPNEIFVIKSSIDLSSESEHVSTLLVDEKKKKEYDTIFKSILELRQSFVAKINRLSGVKKEEIEKQILIDFKMINLENKIVLSIALRSKAEKYMIDKISDPEFLETLFTNCLEKNSSQTYPIFKKYTTMFPEDIECRSLIDEINLTTPENIHVNSFMFEPILDISDTHLTTIKKIECQFIAMNNK